MNGGSNNTTLGILRYFLGLAVLVSPFFLAFFVMHVSPSLIFMMLMTFPVAPLFYIPVLTGFYFMFTPTYRWRIDITLLILTVICLIALSGIVSGLK